MKKLTKRLLTAAVIVVLLFVIAWPKLDFSPASSGGPGPAAGGPTQVTVRAVVARAAPLSNQIMATGSVLANEDVDIRSEINGKVTRVLFREGDRVQRGAVLLRINDDELRAELQQLAFREQLLQQSEERQRVLLDKEAISQQEYDVALTELNSLKSEIENLKARIDKYVIRAPFDGVIGLRYVSEGSYLTPATQIATLVDLDPAKIDFSIPAKYSQSVRMGDSVTFRVENAEQAFRGVVYAIEPKIDPATRTLQVRARSPNPLGTLLPGAFASVELELKRIEAAIMIPTEALIPDVEGHQVFISRNGKAESVRVQVGMRLASTVQIDQGLTDGDTVVSSGILQLRAGVPLNIVTLTDMPTTPDADQKTS